MGLHLRKENMSTYDYPLLIKNILSAPLTYKPETEIVYQDKRYTYARFHERIAKLAGALRGLGVRQGDTVAVLDWDSNRYLECYFAVPMIGAVLHTVNVRLPAEQLAYTIEHAEDDVILVHSDFLPLLEAIRGRLHTVKHFVLLSDDGKAPTTRLEIKDEYETLLAKAQSVEEYPDFDENTRATMFYTTGTTGLPKGVSFSHRQLVLMILATSAAFGAYPAATNFHSEDVYMPITPMFHVHAWAVPYIATFLGVKQVYPGKYAIPNLLGLIKKEGVTFSHCVPTILAMLLSDPVSCTVDLSHWKVAIGGAALPKALCSQALDRGVDVFAGYGMSETGPDIAFVHLRQEDLKKSKEEQIDMRVRIGIPIGLVQMKVVDPEGAEQPRDDHSAGEILLRAPWLTKRYFKDEANSEKLWEGDWLHTQDVAVRNEAGSFRITDRLKDVIKVGGEWLSSIELEDILSSHSAVGEVSVIGLQDKKWGEIPAAVVVLKSGMEAKARVLIDHVKSYVDKGVIPRQAILIKVFFSEAIPKTSVGKVDKKSLRATYATAQ
jgi:fatty-acyl-CoA synthase